MDNPRFAAASRAVPSTFGIVTLGVLTMSLIVSIILISPVGEMEATDFPKKTDGGSSLRFQQHGV